MKRIVRILLLIFVISLTACAKRSNDKDIVIIYTTDIHCSIDDVSNSNSLGYAKVSAYKNAMIEDNNYVALADAGDFILGDYIGTISKGSYIIDIMNQIGYDVVTLGNHEFDYGFDQLSSLLSNLNSDIVSCNIKYEGSNENKIDMVKPYVIKTYGKYDVGFVGVTTPNSLSESSPSNFMEDGKYAYSFSSSTTQEFYDCVQSSIDACKNDGADYIILLSHLGYSDVNIFSSKNLIKNINGVDVIMDGHQHLDLNWISCEDKDGKEVRICDAGYKLNEFGKLTIKKDGKLEYDFITDYEGIDQKIADYIGIVRNKSEELGNRVLATSDISLSIFDEEGIRLVRSRETPIGNLIADAYRSITGADIAFVNGGGIRDNLKSGDISFKDIMAIHPYGNTVCIVKASGKQILDLLEMASRLVQSDYKKDGIAIGECGGFLNVSGLRYSIDTSIESTVEVDSNNMFVKVNGARRVNNVMVLENGEYVPLDVNKTYIVASHNYLIQNGGDGLNQLMNNELLPFSEKYDYEVLVEYIVNVLHGNLKDKYSDTEGRITVK